MKTHFFVAIACGLAVSLVGLSIAADGSGDGGSAKTCSLEVAASSCGQQASADQPVACPEEGCSAGGCCMTAAVAGTDGDGACPLENSCGAKCCAKKCPVVKCPVSGVPVSRTVWAKYDGGKVYFGCAGCKAKFEKDPKKYAAKAHQQLVLTGQFEQKACPISGAPVNPEVKIDLGGVSVAFCCGGCRAKLAKAPPEEQVELVFNDATFAKAFAPKKKTPKKQGESKVADSKGT